MPKPDHPGDPKQEDVRYANNPSAEQNFDKTHKDEASKKSGADNGTSSVAAAENDPTQIGSTTNDASSQESAPWKTELGKGKNNKDSKKKQSAKSKRKKRILFSIAMMVATSVLGMAAFFIFLPMKIVNIMENLKESASQLAQRPVETRMQFLVTSFIAGKIVAGEDGNEFDRYVCPSGGIICSVFKTWRINKFEEKLGLTIESNRSGNGRATSWKVTSANGTVIEGEGGDFDEILEQVNRQIDGTRAMRAWLREEVGQETKWYNVIQRHAMRKMLMRKYGVTGWRGPERLENKYDTYAEYKQAIKNKLKETFSLASLGRVLKRSALLIGCLTSDSPNCQELQREESPPPEAPEEGGSENDQRGRQAASEGQSEISDEGSSINVEEVAEEAANASDNSEEVSRQLRSIVTKRILAAGVAGIGIIDVLADVVEKIEGGSVNAMAEYKNEIAYIGYATEWATIEDKFREGDLDPDMMQEAAEIMANYDKSPLAQHEAGTAKDLGKPGHEVERDCDEDGELEKLPPGEFICPNKKITYDVTAFLTSWPAWDSVVVPIATAWNNSVGAVFDFFNAVAGGILEAIGFNKLMEWVIDITGIGDLAESVMEDVVSTFIGSPVTGAEEDAEAYDATSIGVKGMYNGMTKVGVDQEGNGMGLGGEALTDDEIAEIKNAYARDAEESFKSKNLMARLFDPALKGSAANTIIARMPTNFADFMYTPIMQLSTFASPLVGAYPYTGENLAGYAIHGYPEDSPALTAPPEAYTEESCKASAEAREASYSKQGDELSPRYHEVDGCALEKVVRLAATAAYTDEHMDEFKLYQNQSSSSAPSGVPGETEKLNKGWSLKDNTDYSGTACAAGTTETEIYTHPKRGFKIRLCKVGNVIVASIASGAVANMINAAKSAGVTLTGGGFRSYEEQISVRETNCTGDPLSESASCNPPTAVPGSSQHERGLAIDFADGGTISKGSPQFQWLQANAATYGFFNLPSEPWHWSTSGN